MKSEPVGGGAERTDLFVVERNNGEWVNACDGTDYSCFLSLSEAEEALKAEADNCEEGESLYRIVRFTRVGASLSAQTPPVEADRKCPKCGTTMCGKFDYRPGPTPLTELAIPNGQFSCLKCGYDPLSNEELTTIFRKHPCDHGNATSMPIGECTMTTECAKETIAQLTLEIRNLAHHGWEDRPNAEFLFREIGKRAQKVSALSGAAQDGDCPCGATVVRKSDSANKSKLCADCAAQEEAPGPDAGFDEATETRWQGAIYELCKEAVGPANDHLIDGGGTDSGDALDFTLAEIRQAIGFWRDKFGVVVPEASYGNGAAQGSQRRLHSLHASLARFRGGGATGAEMKRLSNLMIEVAMWWLWITVGDGRLRAAELENTNRGGLRSGSEGLGTTSSCAEVRKEYRPLIGRGQAAHDSISIEGATNMSEGSSSSSGIGVVGLLGVMFVTLKLLHIINWSWWWVTLPFWGGFALFFGIIAACILLKVIVR